MIFIILAQGREASRMHHKSLRIQKTLREDVTLQE